VACHQAFKRLLKEDSVDYAAYSASIPTRKRPGRFQVDSEAGHVNGHPVGHTMPRRKSVAAVTLEYDVSDIDVSDEDWGGSKSGRRKSVPTGRITRGKK